MELVRQAVSGVRYLYEQKQQTLRFSLPTYLIAMEADAIRLIQVVTNLLTNASRYSLPETGEVWISLEHQGDQAILCVQDNGN